MTSISAAVLNAIRQGNTGSADPALALRGRRCTLLVGDTEIVSLPAGLRVTFSIEKTLTRSANKGTITVANLSRETRARIESGKQRVVLEAGYDRSVGAIFVGTAYRIATKQAGPDLITTLECADGGAEIGTQAGSWSVQKGTQVIGIVRELVTALGLPLSSASVITPSKPTFTTSWAFAGSVASALDAVTKASGLTWSVQDQQVQILSGADDGSDAIVLRSDSGLIGTPERVEVKEGDVLSSRVQAVALIQPQIRPGRIVDLTSLVTPALSGQYVVAKQKISGDSHGTDWTTSLEMTAHG